MPEKLTKTATGHNKLTSCNYYSFLVYRLPCQVVFILSNIRKNKTRKEKTFPLSLIACNQGLHLIQSGVVQPCGV